MNKTVKLYHNKDWLYDQHWNQEKSIAQISREQNVHFKTIWYWFEKYNIKRRKKGLHPHYETKFDKIDYDILYDLYIIQRRTWKEISKELNVSENVISKALLYHNLKGKRTKNKYLKSGYYYIHKDGKHKKVCREIIEKKIGRKLKTEEIVHHKNFDKADDRIENLSIVSRAEHARIHMEQRCK